MWNDAAAEVFIAAGVKNNHWSILEYRVFLNELESFLYANYESHGYDIAVECWDVKEVMQVVGTKPIQIKTAAYKIRKELHTIVERRAEVLAEIF